LDGSNLPKHDTSKDHYECGSNNFNIPYYIWVSLTFVALAATIAVFKWENFRSKYVLLLNAVKWVALLMPKDVITDIINDDTLQKLRERLENACRVVLLVTAYIIVALLPIHTACSLYYGSWSTQYAWSVSAAFLSGRVPFALEFVSLLALPFMLLCAGKYIQSQQLAAANTYNRSVSNWTFYCVDWQTAEIYSLYIFINIVVVVGINVSFIYVAIYQSSSVLVLAQLLLSLFKLFWNGFAAPKVLLLSIGLISADKNLSAIPGKYGMVQISAALLNNVVIPCLVVACVSPSCFYNVFASAPELNSIYFTFFCSYRNDDQECEEYTVENGETVYYPPFNYNYQCSSAIITYYAAPFVYMCLMSTVLVPLLELAVVYLHKHATANTRWYNLLHTLLPATWKAPSAGTAQKIVDKLHIYLGLLLTFGAVFPPLAVALAYTFLFSVLFTRLKLGRFLHISAEHHDTATFLRFIETELAEVGNNIVMHQSMWMLITLSCWFYTLFLFDALGDAVGFQKSYWVLIVVPVLPLLMYVLYSYAGHYYNTTTVVGVGGRMQGRMQGSEQPSGGDCSKKGHSSSFSVEIPDIGGGGSTAAAAVEEEEPTFNVMLQATPPTNKV
jgi:hypothetical protein